METINPQSDEHTAETAEPKPDWVERTAIWFEVLAQWLEAFVNYPIRLVRWVISCIRTFPRFPKFKSFQEIRSEMAQQSIDDRGATTADNKPSN